jgi:hypothetical protein
VRQAPEAAGSGRDSMARRRFVRPADSPRPQALRAPCRLFCVDACFMSTAEVVAMTRSRFVRGFFLRTAGPIAVAAVLLLAAPGMSSAFCCICEGVNLSGFNDTCPSAVFADCSGCANACGGLNGTMRACCDTADCSGGVADTCSSNACTQTAVGIGGFCDGTCAGSAPTPTPTPASAPAPAMTSHGLLLALAVLGGLAAVALRRRRVS